MPLLPPSVRFVFFDLGKILLDFDWERARSYVASHSPLSPEQVDRRFRAEVPWTDFELGNISADDFFARARTAVSYSGPEQDFVRAFCDIFTPIQKNLTLAREIESERPGATGILSNTNAAHIAHIEQEYPQALAPFALRLYSYDLGLRKPHTDIYRAATEAAGTAAGNILFIDDLSENIEGACQAGWLGIFCPPGTDLRAQLGELGASLQDAT